MRYHINFQKLVNRFVPHYLGGRKLILFLQSCVYPLQSVNDMFSEWAKETRIEASMTSQVFKFEWFLNRKFSKYFLNASERISIKNGERLGVPIYFEAASIDQNEHMLLYNESEENVETSVLYHDNDITDVSSHSFTVYSPTVDTTKISQDSYDNMLRYYIDKYKISSKSYNIIYNS